LRRLCTNIKKEWVLSSGARRLYRAGALLSLMLLFLLAAWLSSHPVSNSFQPIARLLLLMCIAGSLVTLVGMNYFLFRYDRSHPFQQLLWFLAMLWVPIGPALYCVLVYSRATRSANDPAKLAP